MSLFGEKEVELQSAAPSENVNVASNNQGNDYGTFFGKTWEISEFKSEMGIAYIQPKHSNGFWFAAMDANGNPVVVDETIVIDGKKTTRKIPLTGPASENYSDDPVISSMVSKETGEHVCYLLHCRKSCEDLDTL